VARAEERAMSKCHAHAFCVCLAAASCGADHDRPTPTQEDAAPPVPVSMLIGEIHLHQFPLGSHAWAGFLDAPLPLARAHPDQLVEYEVPPTATEGPCTLHLEPTCTPRCGPRTFCSATDTCTAFTPLRYVDAGEVRVLGSTAVPSLRMFYNGAESTYDTEPQAGPIQIFKGGDRLALAGGKGDYAFSGTIPAPPPVEVTQPDFGKDLHLPLDADLPVAWTSEHSLAVVVLVTVSAHDGPLGYVRCNTADTGSITVPRSMMAKLPRPPRDIRLEVERYEERVMSVARPGVGIFVNVAQSTWKNGADL